MEGMILLLGAVGLLVGFDLLAVGFRVDSRDTVRDDQVRSVQGWPRW